MRMFRAEPLQCAQVVRIAEFATEVLEDSPIILRGLMAELAPDMTPEVFDDAVVVEQRVVHVEKENDFAPRKNGLLHNDTSRKGGCRAVDLSSSMIIHAFSNARRDLTNALFLWLDAFLLWRVHARSIGRTRKETRLYCELKIHVGRQGISSI